MKSRSTLVAAAALLLMCGTSHAQFTFDFESDLEGWSTSGFGNGSEFISLSATGATAGSSQAMAFGHDGGNFSWDSSLVFGVGEHPLYGLLSDLGNDATGQTINFDVTYVANDLPTFSTFANLSFSLQSDNGFKQVDGIAEINELPNGEITIPVSLPLDGPTAGGDISGFAADSSFYRLTIALNTDGSLAGGTSTVYVDNITITPEPSSLLMAALACSVLGTVRRRQ